MKIYIKFILLGLLFISFSCTNQPQETTKQEIKLQGETMGTYYRVIYKGNTNHQHAIDSLLKEMLLDLSTYIPEAKISLFNAPNAELLIPENQPSHFQEVFAKAKEIYTKTNGAFEPTIMPLVNYWGFGYTEKKMAAANPATIDSLKVLIDFGDYKVTKIKDENNKTGLKYTKEQPNAQLDFSAIAKGYGVDIIGELLEASGVQNYYIDIGGESQAKGKNARDTWWSVGINTPKEDAEITDIQQIVYLQNKSIASSGNYRNFHEKEGIKYGHTINPKTGYPEKNTLLSASIIANDCMTADAYATACMVLGIEKAFKLITKDPTLEGYFIFGDENGSLKSKYTPGLKEFLLKK